jgi:predicted amidohydrolase
LTSDSTRSIRIAAAQTPEFREDVGRAMAYAIEVVERAEAQGVKLLCFPEGYLQGYLTEEPAATRCAYDLSSPDFQMLMRRFPDRGPMIVIGLIERAGESLYNTAAVIHRQALVGRYRKRHLLGAEACFQPGDDPGVFDVDGLRFGINICFDANFASAAARAADAGASLLVCPANNMLRRKAACLWKDRHNAVRGDRCRETGLWLISADVTGEREDLVAWGPTAVLTPTGEVAVQLPLDAPGLLVVDLPRS